MHEEGLLSMRLTEILDWHGILLLVEDRTVVS